MIEDIAYATFSGGHRTSYLQTCSKMFSLLQVCQRLDYSLFMRLLNARRLLFVTIDDAPIGFLLVAVARAMIRRPTVGLFLGVQRCLDRDLRALVKRAIYRCVKRIPGLTLGTISPFNVYPSYANFANVGVCDPQYWDLIIGGEIQSNLSSMLSEQVRRQADGRRVMVILGRLGTNKGLDVIARTLTNTPDINRRVLVVCAGPSTSETSSTLTKLRNAGALVVNRYITDVELGSLYSISTFVWSCYAPGYDHASGIFGRAVQYGRIPIVRSGSVIAKFAQAYDLPHTAVDFGDEKQLIRVLESELAERFSPELGLDRRRELLCGWRTHFQQALGLAMSIRGAPYE